MVVFLSREIATLMFVVCPSICGSSSSTHGCDTREDMHINILPLLAVQLQGCLQSCPIQYLLLVAIHVEKLIPAEELSTSSKCSFPTAVDCSPSIEEQKMLV
ncbi:hypothetical protein CHARACLAT_027486 [Characodon lateralis]|uniref:Secreted protein n=1 Tax=Characodon lateralis TaxID=208331 RepID=A0ABU7EDA0_9TELE|nr:hypothetical protein [Characodon lateralis]